MLKHLKRDLDDKFFILYQFVETKIPFWYINYEIKFVFEQIFTLENNNKN